MRQGLTSNSTLEFGREVPCIRLSSEEELTDIYEFGKKLGQGTYGAVYEAVHIATQTKWAIKVLCRPPAGSPRVEMLDNEIEILKQVNHPSIIHLEAIYSTAMMIYMVIQLCEGGDLGGLLKQKTFLAEDVARKIMGCLADAVTYLHKRNIVHRDLKLENILLKNPFNDDKDEIEVKVADFGLSVKTDGIAGEMMSDACGTLVYMAPEMLSERDYSHWCDEWSLGVIMYMLLCGVPPFISKSKKHLLKKMAEREDMFTQPIWSTISDGAKYIVAYLLEMDPAFRMSASELMNSSWVKGDDAPPSEPSNVVRMMQYVMNREDERERSLSVLGDPSMNSLSILTEADAEGCAQTEMVEELPVAPASIAAAHVQLPKTEEPSKTLAARKHAVMVKDMRSKPRTPVHPVQTVDQKSRRIKLASANPKSVAPRIVSRGMSKARK